MKLFIRIALLLAAVYLGFLTLIYTWMLRPPEQFAAAIAKLPGPAFLLLPFETLWFRARAGHIAVGQEAPDFRLRTLDGKSSVSLSSFRGQKPVILVFGSYT